jgi:hypothetical protein
MGPIGNNDWASSALVRFRPGPPRILKTREVVHRISSVGRGLSPFPLGFPTFPLTRDVVLNDKPI